MRREKRIRVCKNSINHKSTHVCDRQRKGAPDAGSQQLLLLKTLHDTKSFVFLKCQKKKSIVIINNLCHQPQEADLVLHIKY